MNTLSCPQGYRCVIEPQWSPETYWPLFAAVVVIVAISVVAYVIHGRLSRK